MKPIKIIAFNLGSTSTKIAYYENDQCVFNSSIAHSLEVIRETSQINDQLSFRKQAILDFRGEQGISLNDLDSVTTRGGFTEPIVSGTYRINEAMVEQALSGRYGSHVCNLGGKIAFDLCKDSGAVPLTTDTPTTDEFEPLARYSGLKGISRTSLFHALNQKAMSRYYAEIIGRKYEDLNLITVMLGGGVSVVPHKHGRMVDGPNAVDGEGAFSNNRSGSLPVGELIKLCYSKGHTLDEMLHLINGGAGLMSYLGIMNVQDIVGLIEDGDSHAAEVLEGLCYQTAKDVGAYAAVLEGEVDAIILTGGMAHSTFITSRIERRVSFIAPVVVLPGEREMESLGLSSYKALTGQIPMREFVPRTGEL
jgi:butyrate kinase